MKQKQSVIKNGEYIEVTETSIQFTKGENEVNININVRNEINSEDTENNTLDEEIINIENTNIENIEENVAQNSNENTEENTINQTTQAKGQTISENWEKGLKSVAKQKPLSDLRFVLGKEEVYVTQTPRLADLENNDDLFRSDWISDIAQIEDTTVFATAMRGAAHYGSKKIRQDAYAIGKVNTKNGDFLIVAIADGVGNGSHSHLLADFVVNQAIKKVKNTLLSGIDYKMYDWKILCSDLVKDSQIFVATYMKNNNIAHNNWSWLSLMGSTLDFAIIQTKKNNLKTRDLIFVSLAGDGAAYILSNQKGWKYLKYNEKIGDDSSLVALPNSVTDFNIIFHELFEDECLFMVTDGLGDLLQRGNTELGGFFQSNITGNLTTCTTLISFLRIVSIAEKNLGDDRTAILVK